MAKLAEQGDCEAIKKNEEKYGAIPEEIKLSLGFRTSDSNFQTSTSSSKPCVLLWGSGNPKREFLHVDDLADACIFLTKMNEKAFDLFFDHNHTPLINIGCGKDQTVKEIAAIVAEVVGYNGGVSWDQDKPDGTLQKLLDISKIKKLGWKPNIALKAGIRNVYEWYLKDIKG